MLQDEKISICLTCRYKKFDLQKGLLCYKTSEAADFDDVCPNYLDEILYAEKKQNLHELQFVESGRKKTLLFFSGLVCFSIAISLFHNYSTLFFYEQSSNSILKDILRTIIEIGLYYAVFNGKSWAKVLLTILMIIAILFGISLMISLLSKSLLGLLIIIPLCVFGLVITYLNADKNFLLFFEYQQLNK